MYQPPPPLVNRVCDRGTFSHAVDLSRGAFAQLAPLSSGVIDVTVEPLS